MRKTKKSFALAPGEIKQIRKKLKLTQKVLGQICGGGPCAISRYETGKVVPIASTSNLLRLLNKYPNEIENLINRKKGETK